jgi:hypothetical protein
MMITPDRPSEGDAGGHPPGEAFSVAKAAAARRDLVTLASPARGREALSLHGSLQRVPDSTGAIVRILLQ